MQKLMFILLFLAFSSAMAKSPSPPAIEAQFKSLSTCTKNNYAAKLSKFDQDMKNYFMNKSTAELLKIYKNEDLESEALRFFAPHLLRGNVLAEADKECWANYKEMINNLKMNDPAQQSRQLEAWQDCIQSSYNKKFKAEQLVGTCLKSAIE